MLQPPGRVRNEDLPVRVYVDGAGEWRDLTDWPPPQLARQPCHFDLFARLCDVDPRGRSRNVCDGIIRHRPGAGGGDEPEALTVPMSATAYRFAAGHRLRLQVSGGPVPASPATPAPESRPPPRPGLSRWTCNPARSGRPLHVVTSRAFRP